MFNFIYQKIAYLREYWNFIKSKNIYDDKNLKYYFFIFRWFLIGKYHCENAQNYIKLYWIFHKILWTIIIVSVAVFLASFIEFIKLFF